MDILAALRQEEAKFEKEVSAAQRQLDNARAAMKLLVRLCRFQHEARSSVGIVTEIKVPVSLE